MTITIDYQYGTLLLTGPADEIDTLGSLVSFDDRVKSFRASGLSYGPIMRLIAKQKIPFEDKVKDFEKQSFSILTRLPPRPYQKESVEKWRAAQGRGVVVLPTGAGKSYVAMLAIEHTKRNTLVVAPTLDLVRQWRENLSSTFGIEIGVLGGGEHQIEAITVSTYDSAAIHMEHLGNRFGLVVFDECHHLPAESNAFAAHCCIAPFRLGLSATPERSDGLEDRLEELIGRTVCRHDIHDMSGEYLSEYETLRVAIDLSQEERKIYERERGVYLSYIRSQNISFSSQRAWADFVMRASRSKEGKRALKAHRKQKALAMAAPGKINFVGKLLHQHKMDRTIIFTADNATAYEISQRFLVPIITHETKIKERSHILKEFAAGSYRAVATSKVLNEGVDVPDANVAVVVSGSSSVREHVQRLGRILRKREGKQALLYELVTADTTETYTSDRRREHNAYRKKGFGFK